MLSDITILDLETTGLNPLTDRVIEFAAMRIIDGNIRTCYESIVNPEGVKIDPEAAKVNGLTDEVVSKGANQKLAFTLLRNVIGDSTIVAHNAAFDLAFLSHTYARLGGQPLANNFLCTRTVAAFRYPAPSSLKDLCARFGIINHRPHRAMDDVQATWELLYKMDEASNCDEFLNVMGYYKKYAAPAWVPEYATLRGY